MFKNIPKIVHCNFIPVSPNKKIALKVYSSAFSLIEVLVALLILSIGTLGLSKMLLTSTTSYQKAEWREQVLVMGWSIAETLRGEKNDQMLQKTTLYWQEKLDKLLPGNRLTIQKENKEGRGFYLIRISQVTDVTKTFELRIYPS